MRTFCQAKKRFDEDEAFKKAAQLSVVTLQVESVLQCVAVCCSVLQCVAVCCRKDETMGNMFQLSVAMLQVETLFVVCVAVCCSLLRDEALE